MPKTVKEVYDLDAQNGNTLWADAISKEMESVKVAFKIPDNGDTVPRDHQFVRCHMIFDVKMEDFRRKARFVAGGHMTETPKCTTYSSVVEHETVQITLTISALNNLQVKAGDMMNVSSPAGATKDMNGTRPE